MVHEACYARKVTDVLRGAGRSHSVKSPAFSRTPLFDPLAQSDDTLGQTRQPSQNCVGRMEGDCRHVSHLIA